jgi:hypothetical protein
MDIVFQEGSTKYVRGWDASRDLNVTLSSSPIYAGGLPQPGVQGDKITLVTALATVSDGYILSGSDAAQVTVEVLTPGVCSYANGRVDRIANGAFSLRLTHPTKGAMILSGFMASVSGQTITGVTGFTAGSLAAHIDAQVRALVAGKTAGDTAQKWYSSWVPATDTYVRNPSHILAGLDLTGVSVASQHQVELGTHQGFATMISPRHFATARHYPPQVGTYLKFMDASGTVYTRTVQALNSSLVVQGQSTALHDMAIGMLDSALPAGIKVYKVLPESVTSKMTGFYSFGLPNIGIRTFGVGMKTIIYGYNTDRFSQSVGYETRPPIGFSQHSVLGLAADLNPWTLSSNTTSSAPAFFPINGELVYLGSQFTSGGNPWISGMIPEIEAWMASTDPAYPTLTKVDLSSFTTFP